MDYVSDALPCCLWVFTWLAHINSMKVVPFMALPSFIVDVLVLIVEAHYGLYSDTMHIIASIGIVVA